MENYIFDRYKMEELIINCQLLFTQKNYFTNNNLNINNSALQPGLNGAL